MVTLVFVSVATSSLSSAACFWDWLSRCANSASVSSDRVPMLTGRCMGMSRGSRPFSLKVRIAPSRFGRRPIFLSRCRGNLGGGCLSRHR